MTDEQLTRELARIGRETPIKLAVDKALDALFNEINGGSSEVIARLMAERFQREHRTLQQGLMTALKGLIETYAGFDHDLRNEDAVEWAAKVKEAGAESYMRRI